MIKKCSIFIIAITILFSLNVKANFIVNSSLTQEFKVEDQKVVSGNIVVQNLSNKETKVKLYKRDYTFNAKGKNYYYKPGKIERSNANWIKLAQQRITLEPQQKKSLEYKIVIPQKAVRKGTYWSMLMVEKIPNQRKNLENLKEIKVRQSIRYGVQIITDFTGNQKINLSYQDSKLKKIKGSNYLFKVAIKNTGISDLKARIKILLIARNSGEIIKEFKKDMHRIFPATSINVTQQIKLKRKVPYQLVLLLGNEEDGYFGKKYLLEVSNN